MFRSISTTATALAACLAAVLFAGRADAGPRIVNGVLTQDYATTGALLYSGSAASPINANNASSWCSGTLIGCRTFLTAAHCVYDDTAASHYWVYLQHGGLRTVASVAYAPGYDPDFSGDDVAIVKLGADVTGIDPTTINSTHDLDALGTGLAGVIVGFGKTGGAATDYGIKRAGEVVTADCDTGATGGEGNDVLVCWDFLAPLGPAGEDSNTCNGDSGGPLFMDFGSGEEVVGVTSAGTSTTCLAGDHSWDASVYANRAWISAQLGADSTGPCGGLPAVGDPTVLVDAQSGSLSAGNVDDAYSFSVGGTPSLLRVTLNGKDNGSFDPDLFVKQGTPATTSVYDCKADGDAAFGSCEFSGPAAGTWYVLVRRNAGTGDYQVTSTVFGGEPPECGNGAAESGEDCDGGDDDACPGLCTMACECPAPMCGNGVAESGEDCDGADDSACPGQCDGGCGCPATCNEGDLYGLVIRSDEAAFLYKALLYDPLSSYADLDPRAELSLAVTDGVGSVDLEIPPGDPGWSKSKPSKRRFRWKGDGSLDGLRVVKLRYKARTSGSQWVVLFKGRSVPGAGSIDVNSVLDFDLRLDGSCQLESW